MADKKGTTRQRSNKVNRPRNQSRGLGGLSGNTRRNRVDAQLDRMTRGQSTDHLN